AVDSQQPEDLPWLTAKAHAVHGPDLAALLVVKQLGQLTGFDHRGFASCLAWIFQTREAGAPACCRLMRLERSKPATCRRSGLCAIRGGREISKLAVGLEARGLLGQRKPEAYATTRWRCRDAALTWFPMTGPDIRWGTGREPA